MTDIVEAAGQPAASAPEVCGQCGKIHRDCECCADCGNLEAECACWHCDDYCECDE